MKHPNFLLAGADPLVVGSFGGPEDMAFFNPEKLHECCDLAEIRLDLVAINQPADSSLWKRFRGTPLLFTARCGSEGGAGDMSAAARIDLLETAMMDADCIDIEVASIGKMGSLLATLKSHDIPWVASFHDFGKLPETAMLKDAARRAADAGASVFKVAAMLHSAADMARLAEFQLADHGIAVATMGMGPLAPVSRLLCAQCGSLLNYGYLGKTPTAPGQWDAAFLKQAIARLAPLVPSSN